MYINESQSKAGGWVLVVVIVTALYSGAFTGVRLPKRPRDMTLSPE